MFSLVMLFGTALASAAPRSVANATSQPIALSHAILADNLWQRIADNPGLPLDDHPRVRQQREQLLAGKHALEITLRHATPYLFNIVSSIESANLPVGLALLPAIESAFDPRAVSPMKAAGIWQFMPETGLRYGLSQNTLYDARLDEIRANAAATELLTALGNRYDGDWLLALAAYNTGPGNVNKALTRARAQQLPEDFWHLKLPRETSNYVPKLLALLQLVAHHEHYQLRLPPIANQPVTLTVMMPERFDLVHIADITGLSLEQLRKLNPALTTNLSPPDGLHNIQLPLKAAQRLYTELRNNPQRRWHGIPTYHVVVSGDSLSELAQRYNTTTARLKQINNLPDSKIRIGKKLIVGSRAPDHPRPAGTAPPKTSPGLDYRYQTHVVESGDSLWGLSRELETPAKQLQTWNDIGAPNAVLSVGDQLHAATLTPQQRPSQLLQYRVSEADTVSSIADKFDVTVLDLKRSNRALQQRDFLSAGQTLSIPLPYLPE